MHTAGSLELTRKHENVDDHVHLHDHDHHNMMCLRRHCALHALVIAKRTHSNACTDSCSLYAMSVQVWGRDGIFFHACIGHCSEDMQLNVRR